MPLPVRIALFLCAIFILIGATSVYVYRRSVLALKLEKRGKRALVALLVAGPLMMLAARWLESSLPAPIPLVLGVGGGAVVLAVWISTVLLWAVDLPYGLRGLMRWRRHSEQLGIVAAPALGATSETATENETESETELASVPEVGPALGRREVVRRVATGAALSVGFGSAFYGALFGRHDYEVSEVAIPIPGLSPRLDGYQIAQISDIHFGAFVGETELRAAVELVRRARPDMVVLTGDLLDHDAAHAPVLGRLVRALGELGLRDGVKIIPGNHDYYAGVDEVLGACRRAGGTVLVNEGTVIQDDLALLGVDDVWSRRNGYTDGPDLAAAIATVPADLPRVLLAHNPVFFEEARGEVALQLSGHTHGGQVNLGLRPAHLFLPYVEGIYREEGSTLYVNRGFGTAGPPARVTTPPEVTLVILESA